MIERKRNGGIPGVINNTVSNSGSSAIIASGSVNQIHLGIENSESRT